MKALRTAQTIALAVLAASLSMAAQRTPQPSQAGMQAKQYKTQPPKDVHKVWTNDDLISLGTPADRYLADKEAEAAAQPAALGVAPAEPTPQPAPPIKLPETVGKTQQLITEDTQEISDAKEKLDQLKVELDAAAEDQKAGKQSEIERRTKNLAATQAELKALQDNIQKLSPKQAGASATPQP